MPRDTEETGTCSAPPALVRPARRAGKNREKNQENSLEFKSYPVKMKYPSDEG